MESSLDIDDGPNCVAGGSKPLRASLLVPSPPTSFLTPLPQQLLRVPSHHHLRQPLLLNRHESSPVHISPFVSSVHAASAAIDFLPSLVSALRP